MGFHEVPWNSMRFYDVLVNRSVPTEANRGLTSYSISREDRLATAKPNRTGSQLGEACLDRQLQIEGFPD
jgi:hypothetical protein